MPRNAKKYTIDNDAWIAAHFEKIVNKYAGRYVLVINKKVYPVNEDNIVEVENQLRKKYGTSPIGLPVPKPKDFVHILIW